jgi:hypothetical protein
MWSARPTGIADDRRRTNDVDLDERRPIIEQRRNGALPCPPSAHQQGLTTVRESLHS